MGRAAKSRSVSLLLASALTLTMSACGGGGQPGSKVSGEASVTVATLSGDGFWNKANMEDFTKKTGIKLNILEFPHDNEYEKLVTEAVSGSGAIDVIMADQLWLGDFAARGFADPIELDDESKADIGASSQESLSFNGKLYAVPYETQAPVLYYRTDLMKQAGIEVPKTWDEMRTAAKKLTDSSKGIFGYSIEGKQSIDPAIHFIDKLIQAGGSVVEGDKVSLDSPAAVKALQYLLDLQYTDNSSPEGAPGFETNDLTNLMAQGKLAMAPNWQYAWSILTDPKQSKVPEDVALTLEPGDVTNATTVWSWGWGIMSSSKNKENARAFINWATSAETMTGLQAQRGAPSPRKSLSQKLIGDTSLTEQKRQALKVFAQAVQNGKAVTGVKSWPSIHDEISLMLSRVMSRQADPQTAVTTTAQRIQEILDQK